MPDTKKFLDSAGLSAFLTNLKSAYAANDTARYSTDFAVAQAGKLSTITHIALTGDVTGSATIDYTGTTISISTTIAADTNVIESIGVQTDASTTSWLTPATVDGHNKAVVVDLSGYALKSEVAAVMDYKGEKTGSQLDAMTAVGTASESQNGDVYTCSETGSGYTDGYEYVAVVTKDSGADTYTLRWVELGHTIDLSGYVQTSRTINSKALTSDIVLDGNDIALSTSYAKASATAAVAAGDTVDVAVGKLEKKVDDAISAATTYTFAEGSTSGAFQVTPVVAGVSGTAQSVTVHGLGTAAYESTTAFVSSTLTPAEAGAQVNVIEEITVNGTTIAPTSKSVALTIPEAAASIADGATGYATGDQVYDYVEANKGDVNVIEEIRVNGTTANPDANKMVNIAAVTDVQTKTSASGSYSTVVANGTAQIDLSGYATTADIADFIELSDLSTTDSATGDYVTGVSYNNTSGVFTVAKASKGAVADSDTGLVDGDTVYDYIDAMAMSTTEINALFPSA